MRYSTNWGPKEYQQKRVRQASHFSVHPSFFTCSCKLIIASCLSSLSASHMVLFNHSGWYFRIRTFINLSSPWRTEILVAGMANDGFDLASFFSDCGVPPAASASIVSSGWDVEKFALGFKTESEFDDPDVLTELGVEEHFSRLHRAAMKQAWNRCIQHCKTEMADTAEPSPKNSTAAPSGMAIDTSEGSWSEAFAPKLGGPIIAAMKKKFIKSYPAEPHFTRRNFNRLEAARSQKSRTWTFTTSWWMRSHPLTSATRPWACTPFEWPLMFTTMQWRYVRELTLPTSKRTLWSLWVFSPLSTMLNRGSEAPRLLRRKMQIRW